MCGGLLLEHMLITKLHLMYQSRQLQLVFSNGWHYRLHRNKNGFHYSRLKGRIESGCDKIQYDSAVQLFVQPVTVNVVICH